MNWNVRLLFNFLCLATLALGSYSALACSEFFLEPKSPIDLPSYISEADYLGDPLRKGRWLLGHGSEGFVERVEKSDGSFIVEKSFGGAFEAKLNYDHLKILDALQLKSFETFESFERKGTKHIYPWIKGIPLSKLLESSDIPEEIKAHLWNLYEVRLILLVKEITEKRKDIFFQINVLMNLEKFKNQAGEKENLEFIQLHLPAHLFTKESSRWNQRFLIEMYDFDNQDDSDPNVLEPKPDNILVDPATLDMHWIDPN